MRFTIKAALGGEAMASFHEELARAGVLLDAAGDKTLIEARSREEALEWARRCPTLAGDRPEIEELPC
jgi:hypothetical protein